MSDCGVCIGGGGYDGYAEFQDVTWPVARKAHRCCECRRTIHPGESYQRWSAKWDGDMCCEKTCEYCVEVRDSFTCDTAPAFGDLWEEMRDYVFPNMNTSCFDKMCTPEGKAFLRSKWIDWKFSELTFHSL